MLDVKLIVEKTDFVRQGLLKRMKPEEFNLDEIISSYEGVKVKKQEFEQLRSKQKSSNDEMAKMEKGSEDFKKAVNELKEISQKVKDLEVEVRDLEKSLNAKLEVLPNIPDEDVPAGEKESKAILF